MTHKGVWRYLKLYELERHWLPSTWKGRWIEKYLKNLVDELISESTIGIAERELNQESWILALAVSLISSLDFDKSLNLSESQFPHP